MFRNGFQAKDHQSWLDFPRLLCECPLRQGTSHILAHTGSFMHLEAFCRSISRLWGSLSSASTSSEIICCQLSAIEHLNDKSAACLVLVGVEICHLLLQKKNKARSTIAHVKHRSACKLSEYVKEMKTIRIT